MSESLEPELQDLWDFSSSPEVTNGWQNQPWDPEPSHPARAQGSFRNTTSPLVCISDFSNVQASQSDCGCCWQLYAQPEMCPKEGLENSVTPGHLSPGSFYPAHKRQSHMPSCSLPGLERSELATQVLESITGFFEVGCLFFLPHICYSFYLDFKTQRFGLLSCEREVLVLKSLRWWFSPARLSPSPRSFFYSFGDYIMDFSSRPQMVLAAQETAANKMKSPLLRCSFWRRHTDSKHGGTFLFIRCRVLWPTRVNWDQKLGELTWSLRRMVKEDSLLRWHFCRYNRGRETSWAAM